MARPANRKRRQLMLATGAGVSLAGVGYSLHALKNRLVQGESALSVDLSQLQTGKLLTLDWQQKPVWILRRSASDMATLEGHDALLTDPMSNLSTQPPDCRNAHRSIRPELFVAIGLCTHQGCTPSLIDGVGFLCPCHASRYDLAGRVFLQGPAPANLLIPPHHFENVNRLVIGTDA